MRRETPYQKMSWMLFSTNAWSLIANVVACGCLELRQCNDSNAPFKVSLPILLQCFLSQGYWRFIRRSIEHGSFPVSSIIEAGGSSSFCVSLTRPIFQPDRNIANAEDIQLTLPKIRVIHHAIHRTVVTIEQNFNPDLRYDIGVS